MSAKFFPAGDRALLVELDGPPGVEVNARVRTIDFLLAERRVPGIVEAVPAFCSLLVYYDPYVLTVDALAGEISALLAEAAATHLPRARVIELPCCYDDPACGFELDAAAEQLKLAPRALIERHAAATYLVYFLGFAPGQPYMSAVESPITIPRLPAPRTKTPAGSVGIGGTQCCIYSVESPGGFWVLGHTPVPIYAPRTPEPILLKSGDHVRFHPVDRAEHDAIALAVANRTYRPTIT